MDLKKWAVPLVIVMAIIIMIGFYFTRFYQSPEEKQCLLRGGEWANKACLFREI